MGFLNTSAAATAGGAASSGAGTFLAAAPVVSAIGNVAGAIGTASAQRATLQYQQAVAQGNALLAEQQAIDARSQGTYAEMDLRQRARQVKGAQRAAFAASGVALNEGSPVQIAASTDAMRDADIATIRNNAARQAWGYTVQGGNYGARGRALGAAADAVSPLASGASSLLGSASGVASKWYDLYKSGALGSSAPPAASTGGGRGTYLFESQYPDQE